MALVLPVEGKHIAADLDHLVVVAVEDSNKVDKAALVVDNKDYTVDFAGPGFLLVAVLVVGGIALACNKVAQAALHKDYNLHKGCQQTEG